ncbi:lipopolysaccharide biosynthesis protein [Flammeovirga agarivorans]|uniref:Oligosaccharide flippase family protein n=1 Tax=Flammeovirga agarivorans TaxID=2726742 RepID=A0A7X8SLL0_9BACT|nr:polysaccharide biosynthesis C-terminal domain-containing protein [Flammeovirga agarivorans]NLR92392.1 oligosaccharide flippase family protein [Flammeovirga agarivorans]
MLKKLLSDTVIYGLTTVLMRLINYLLVPLHTKVFDPDAFGIVSIFYSFAVFFNVIYTYGMETTYFWFASKEGSDKEEVFSKILSSLSITSVVFSSILWLFSGQISTLLGFENSDIYVKFFALLYAIDTLLVVPFASLRIDGQAKRFAVLKIIEVVLTVGLNYFFLVTCVSIVETNSDSFITEFVSKIYDPSLGLGYAFLANLISKAIIMILFMDKFIKLKFSWSWKSMKPFYSYGFPLVFAGVAFAINEVSDRLLIPLLLPEGFYSFGDADYAVGVYAACYKLSIFVTFTVTAYKYSAEPFFFNQAGSKDSPKVFARIMYYFVIVLMVMVVAVSANLEVIAPILIRREEYLVGLPVVPILLMANLFLGMYYNLSVWFKVTDNTKYGALISAIGALFTISLNALLVPYFGFYGSAIATFVCYLSMMILAYVLGQKYYPIPYNVKMISFYLIMGGCFLVLLSQLSINGFWESIFIHNAIFALFLLIVFFMERQFIVSTLQIVQKKILKK